MTERKPTDFGAFVPSTDKTAVARRLRILRIALGKTKGEILHQTGLSAMDFLYPERAEVELRVKHAIGIALAYPITLDWIYMGRADGLSDDMKALLEDAAQRDA